MSSLCLAHSEATVDTVMPRKAEGIKDRPTYGILLHPSISHGLTLDGMGTAGHVQCQRKSFRLPFSAGSGFFWQLLMRQVYLPSAAAFDTAGRPSLKYSHSIAIELARQLR